MGTLFFFVISVSSFINANTGCYNIFEFNDVSVKSEQKFNSYFEQRVKSEKLVVPTKLFSFTHRVKKSEHPYGLLKSGFLQLVYLHLFAKSDKDSIEYFDKIDEILNEYQNLSQNIYKQYLNYEIKREQLELVKKAMMNSTNSEGLIDVRLPRVETNLEVVTETTLYTKELLKLHLEHLSAGVSSLTKDVVSEKIRSIEFNHAETYLALNEVLKILKKNIFIYNTQPYVVSRSKSLLEHIESIVGNDNLLPTKYAVKKVYSKISRDNIGFVFRGHTYNEHTEELNKKLKQVLPEDIHTQFGSKTLYESLRFYSRMNILKRITGKVIDRTYFKNIFRFKFMGASVLFVTIWLTNPVEFIQNYNFAQAIARYELEFNDSRYVYKMRSLDDQKFIEVASDIYLIMSKDYFKEVDGEVHFIKHPESDVSPVRTILNAAEKQREFKSEESGESRKKEIAHYHTVQTVKLDLMTIVAFSKTNEDLRSQINSYLLNEHSASLSLSDQVRLMQWISGQRSDKPEINLNLTPVSKEKIIENLKQGLQFDLDIKTINELHEVLNSYGAKKQFDLISSSIWRDLESIKVIRDSYKEHYLKAENQNEFRYKVVEDLAYELTATEFHTDLN